MRCASLDRLIGQLRELPAGGEVTPGLPRAADRERAPATGGPLEPRVLRQRIGAFLTALAARVDEALPAALARAETAWDQVDAFTAMDAELTAELGVLRRAAVALAGSDDAGARAVGLESRLALDAACGLVSLLERRLASLVRARLRGESRELLPGGRPFVDVGAALAEAARAWRVR